jgi:hypothetical protein
MNMPGRLAVFLCIIHEAGPRNCRPGPAPLPLRTSTAIGNGLPGLPADACGETRNSDPQTGHVQPISGCEPGKPEWVVEVGFGINSARGRQKSLAAEPLNGIRISAQQ